MTTISDERLADRELSDMIQSLLNHGEAGFTYVKIDAHLSALRELQSLRTQGGVRVKPLEWEREVARELILGYKARSVAGRYFVEDMGSHRTADRWWLQQDDVLATFSTADEAKAAAQADYERRILASLKASPAPVSERDWTSDVYRDAVKAGEKAAHEYTGGKIGVFLAGLTAYRAALAAKGAAPEPAPVSGEMVERLFQSIAPFIEGTAWREVRTALTAALAAKGGQ